ncbi:hypothetical protein [Streptomyces sp. NRRL S-244]|uniref:hypothetical protein n=1 Tax=Streptomyces sp. NRRL S-244 TaxID=1463897 RepID=UPI00056265DD|nr:hypothetical protein [Streptomyces sp. NRRL S-244]
MAISEGEGAGLPSVRIGDVRGSAFSIGGTDVSNSTVNHGGTGTDASAAGPTAQELLEAVRDLRAALVRLPRSDGRAALDAELDAAAEELESADGEEVRPGLPARLRGALERWAPLVDSVSAATALAALLTSFGG